MKQALFISIFFFLAVLAFARQVEATNSGIANASPGDYIIRSNGQRYVLNQGDIDYARGQLGLSTQRRTNAANVSSTKMNPFSKLILIIIGVVIFVIWIEWQIGKAIGKKLSSETGTVLGVILIFLGVSLFIGVPIIIYSRGPKEIKNHIVY